MANMDDCHLQLLYEVGVVHVLYVDEPTMYFIPPGMLVARKVVNGLEAHGVKKLVIPVGEANKNALTWMSKWEYLLQHKSAEQRAQTAHAAQAVAAMGKASPN